MTALEWAILVVYALMVVAWTVGALAYAIGRKVGENEGRIEGWRACSRARREEYDRARRGARLVEGGMVVWRNGSSFFVGEGRMAGSMPGSETIRPTAAFRSSRRRSWFPAGVTEEE